MSARIISSADLPKRDLSWAADCKIDMDSLAKFLCAMPEEKNFHSGDNFPKRYRVLYLELPGDRYATLTQTELRESVVEVGLEIYEDHIFHRDDLLAVLAMLPVRQEDVELVENDFEWI